MYSERAHLMRVRNRIVGSPTGGVRAAVVAGVVELGESNGDGGNV
jgi:hypothetical protein